MSPPDEGRLLFPLRLGPTGRDLRCRGVSKIGALNLRSSGSQTGTAVCGQPYLAAPEPPRTPA